VAKFLIVHDDGGDYLEHVSFVLWQLQLHSFYIFNGNHHFLSKCSTNSNSLWQTEDSYHHTEKSFVLKMTDLMNLFLPWHYFNCGQWIFSICKMTKIVHHCSYAIHNWITYL
jgi:hypothetical protein